MSDLHDIQACGVCGTDLHIHEGEFIAKFPLIPGHETIGVVVGKEKQYTTTWWLWRLMEACRHGPRCQGFQDR